MLALSATEGVARLLAFGFYLLAARVLSTSAFGEVRFTITLATLAFGLVQVLSVVLPRELGAARTSDSTRVNQVLAAGLSFAALTWALTALAAGIAAALGLTGAARPIGLIAVISGMAAFQLYYSVARGLGRFKRAAFTYSGASAVQLAAFAVAAALTRPTATEALIIFSASSFVPVLLLEARHPILRNLDFRVPREVRRSILRIGGVLVLAQILYLVWNSVDQIWVEGSLGAGAMGLYGAAKTLTQVFLVLPAGVNGVLMPRVAQLWAEHDARRAKRLVAISTLALFVASSAVGVLVVAARVPLLELLFGTRYSGAAGALVGLTVGMVIYGVFMTLTNSAVGWGRPRIYFATIALAALTEVTAFLVIPSGSIAAAAWLYAGSIAVGTLAVSLWLVVRPLERAPAGRIGGEEAAA
jgi:O-antigen/teichoic acid export membrane protein